MIDVAGQSAPREKIKVETRPPSCDFRLSSPAPLPPGGLAQCRPDFLSEGGQARPERFETAIYGLARAIDSVLGGRGRLARSFQAKPGHVIRPAHESLKNRMMAWSVEKLADTGVFFTVTSLPKVMNVHAEAGNPL